MAGPTVPPAEDDDDAYVHFDHRALESEIVEAVSKRLAPEHALIPREVHGSEELYVTYRGVEHKLPLTVTPHDRYVAISSIAELLKDHYRFFVLLPSHDTDTHAILVVPIAVAQEWRSLPEHIAPLRLGFDYFHGIAVPYLNNEDAAPNFARESGALASGSAFAGMLLSAIFSGKADPKAAAALAKDPATREHSPFSKDMKGMSEAEIAAEIQKQTEEALRHPQARQLSADIGRSMSTFQSELQALMQKEMQRLTPDGAPKKPWWKFW